MTKTWLELRKSWYDRLNRTTLVRVKLDWNVIAALLLISWSLDVAGQPSIRPEWTISVGTHVVCLADLRLERSVWRFVQYVLPMGGIFQKDFDQRHSGLAIIMGQGREQY